MNYLCMNKERGILERAIEVDRKDLLFNTARKWDYKFGARIKSLVIKGQSKVPASTVIPL